MSSSIDPENPLTIGKRARTESGPLVTATNNEALVVVRSDNENPLVPPTGTVRRIVKVRRGGGDATMSDPLVPRSVAAQPLVPKSLAPEPNIVPVRNNNRVLRCTRCLTFIKKGAAHSKADCDARIARKAAGRGARKAGGGRPRKFRMTPKRHAALVKAVTQATMGQSAFKAVKSVEKWLKKKQDRLSKSSKRMFGKLIGAFHLTPNAKKLQYNLRRCGL